jgi:hypothetical protein
VLHQVAVDGHQLPQRVLVHIFADAPNNVTLSPVVIPRCDGCAMLVHRSIKLHGE